MMKFYADYWAVQIEELDKLPEDFKPLEQRKEVGLG
jgi:hypothetical protein